MRKILTPAGHNGHNVPDTKVCCERVESGTLPGCRTNSKPTKASQTSAKASLAAIYQTLTHVKFYVSIKVLLNELREALKGIRDVNVQVMLNPTPSEYG